MDLKKLTDDELEKSVTFFRNLMIGVIFGLLIGGLIDNITIKIQKAIYEDDDLNRFHLTLMILIQILLICLFFLVSIRIFQNFVPWIQLTMSGLMFSVTVFIGQENLVSNCTKLLRF